MVVKNQALFSFLFFSSNSESITISTSCQTPSPPSTESINLVSTNLVDINQNSSSIKMVKEGGFWDSVSKVRGWGTKIVTWIKVIRGVSPQLFELIGVRSGTESATTYHNGA